MSDYDQIVQLIKTSTRELDGEAKVLCVIDAVASIVDDVAGTSLGPLNTAGQAIYKNLCGKPDRNEIPNPWFVFNGHEDRESPKTKKYLKSRKYKSMGSTAITVVGGLASAETGGVNLGGVGVHANAVGSTATHMAKILAIANSYKQTKTISEWCNVVMAAKAAKASIRGAQLAGAAIPFASLPASIAAAVAKAGVKLTMTNLCFATAANIHWRAYQEQAISGGLGGGTGGRVGPASRIYWEIFQRRGATRIFGQYDTAALVFEPCGWRALGDKLLLI
jgi:hypothetical protein